MLEKPRFLHLIHRINIIKQMITETGMKKHALNINASQFSIQSPESRSIAM